MKHGPTAPRTEVREDELRGFKQLKRVAELLRSLHGCGCGRDKAGNRQLHFDDYVLLVVFYLMNPMIGSMRMLQDAANLPKVRQTLRGWGLERAPECGTG